MLKKWILRFVAGLFIFIVALLITAPADLMTNQLNSRVPGLQLQGVSGDLWSGRIQQLHYQGTSLSDLDWELSFVSLLSAKLGVDLTINDPLFKGDLSFEQGFSENLSLSDINARQSVVELASHWPPFRMLNPQGVLSWQDVSVSLAGKIFEQAAGIIQWQNAALIINGEEFLLGKINLALDTDKGDLLITLSDDQSVLDLRGTLRFSANTKQYLLKASLKEDLPANISNTVRLMAKPDGNGRLTFSIPGRL